MNSFIPLKLSEDPVVREAVACQLVREGAWVKKSSTAVECQDIFNKLSQNHHLPTPDSHDTVTRRMDLQRLKKQKCLGKQKNTKKEAVKHPSSW